MGFFKKVFGKKGFFDNIGRKIDKGTGGLSSKLFNTVKNVAYKIPVVGDVAKFAIEDLGGALVNDISVAANRDGEVKADKILKTIEKVTGKNVGDQVANAVAVGVQSAIKQETGQNLQIKGANNSTSQSMPIANTGQTFMDKLKTNATKAYDFVKKHWIWFTGVGVLLVIGYIVFGMPKGKKWRV